MTWVYIGLTISVLMFLSGGPVFVVFSLLTTFVILFEFGLSPGTIAQLGFSSLNSFTLLAAPLFILAGNLMLRGGMAKPLITFVSSLVQGLPSGLAVSTIITCGVMGSLTGSTWAVLAAVGAIMVPVMTEAGFEKDFSASVICCSAGLGNIIPPSVFLILYAYLTNGSTTKLFLAGIGPGILMMVLLSVVAVFIGKRRNYPVVPIKGFGFVGQSFVKAIPALILPIIVLGMIYGGICTPTEAAGIACIYCLLCGTLWYKKLTLKDIWVSLSETCDMLGQIIILVAAGAMLGKAFVLLRIPQFLTQWVASADVGPFAFLLLVEAAFVIMGFFMEGMAIMFVMVPIVSPSLKLLGIDPILVGVIYALCILIGAITPPVAVQLYAGSGLFDVHLEDLIKQVWPFLIAMVITLIIFTAVPDIALWIPNLFFK